MTTVENGAKGLIDEQRRQDQHAVTGPAAGELMAFAQGFLLGLARRMDEQSGWFAGKEAADDCRTVAAALNVVPVTLGRAKP